MAEPDLADRRVLLVEDEALVAMLAEDMLTDAGCAVIVAGDLPSALAALARERFDAAVLDVNLRGADSYPLAPALEERGVPFLFASGYGAPLRPGFEGHPVVRKPYRPEEIVRALSALVRRAGAGSAPR